ncbi:MAG: hypothetical protein C0154_03475 [Mucilaginibacter sp.]|nr:MAG: hypothetical protein C0154_03475 [Mucilaginibacter sp.]
MLNVCLQGTKFYAFVAAQYNYVTVSFIFGAYNYSIKPASGATPSYDKTPTYLPDIFFAGDALSGIGRKGS